MKIVGHRGARGLAPENTLASLQAALDQNVDEIEVDVRITKDAVPILFHDRTLLRTEGEPLMVAHHTYQELLEHKEDLCTLAEAIAYVARKVPLVIEVKPCVETGPIIAVLQELLKNDYEPSDFLIASYSQRTLRRFEAALPDIEKVINARFLSIWAIYRARRIGARRLTMNQHFIWFGFVRYVSRSYELVAYTLNDPAKAERWERYGLTGVVTDFPDMYKSDWPS